MAKASVPAIVLTGLFGALCAVSAALQHNDPDPGRWVAIYLGSGGAATLALVRPRWWAVTALVAVVGAGWAAWLWSGVAGQVEATDLWRKMSEKGGRVEELREAGGLTIAALGCAWAALTAARRR